MTLTLVTAPSVEPLTAAEAKLRLNIGDEVSDAVMSAFITAARQMIDGPTGWIGRAMITQTWKLVLDGFPGWYSNWDYPDKGFYPRDTMPGSSRKYFQGDKIIVPLPPLQSVDSITYTDSDGNPQTFSSGSYIVSPGEPSSITLASGASWPAAATTAGSVAVQFKAGYGADGTAVPETMRMAIALQVSHLRSLMQQNLFLRAETVDGVGHQEWTLSSNAGDIVASAVQSLLLQYRVWL